MTSKISKYDLVSVKKIAPGEKRKYYSNIIQAPKPSYAAMKIFNSVCGDSSKCEYYISITDLESGRIFHYKVYRVKFERAVSFEGSKEVNFRFKTIAHAVEESEVDKEIKAKSKSPKKSKSSSKKSKAKKSCECKCPCNCPK